MILDPADGRNEINSLEAWILGVIDDGIDIELEC